MEHGTGRWLSLSDIEISASSYVDPNGFVFHHEGEVFRAVYEEAAGFYRALFDDGTIDRLVASHGLVPSAVTELAVPEANAPLVIHHETVSPTTYCTEWCPSMLRDAARAIVGLSLALLDRRCLLQDCYPWNVLFRGIDPVFIDLTSIVAAEGPLLWQPYEQFQAFFLRALILAADSKGRVARSLAMNYISGITLDVLYETVGTAYKVTHPSLLVGYHADRFIQRKPALKTRLLRSVAGRTAPDERARRRFFEGLGRRLDGFGFGGDGDVWSAYYAEIGATVDRQAKTTVVTAILDRLRPTSVVDLGCNTGAFSVLAAERGAQVIGIDSSEACIERLYAKAKADRLAITPLVADVLCPTPAFGFMGVQYPGLIERAASDTALCLGLMHHLHISGRQSFERIAALMGALARRHLIFEFVARDDDNNALLGAGRAIDYDLDHVVAALREHFADIEVMESDRPTRKILVCTK